MDSNDNIDMVVADKTIDQNKIAIGHNVSYVANMATLWFHIITDLTSIFKTQIPYLHQNPHSPQQPRTMFKLCWPLHPQTSMTHGFLIPVLLTILC